MTSRPVALIMHPEPTIRTMIAEALFALGVRMLESASFQQGIGLAQEARPNLIFVGADLLDEARQECLRGLSARVILVLSSPVDEVLAEPVTMDQIQGVAGRLLSRG